MYDFDFELAFTVRAENLDKALSTARFIRDDLKQRDFGESQIRQIQLYENI